MKRPYKSYTRFKGETANFILPLIDRIQSMRKVLTNSVLSPEFWLRPHSVIHEFVISKAGNCSGTSSDKKYCTLNLNLKQWQCRMANHWVFYLLLVNFPLWSKSNEQHSCNMRGEKMHGMMGFRGDKETWDSLSCSDNHPNYHDSNNWDLFQIRLYAMYCQTTDRIEWLEYPTRGLWWICRFERIRRHVIIKNMWNIISWITTPCKDSLLSPLWAIIINNSSNKKTSKRPSSLYHLNSTISSSHPCPLSWENWWESKKP